VEIEGKYRIALEKKYQELKLHQMEMSCIIISYLFKKPFKAVIII